MEADDDTFDPILCSDDLGEYSELSSRAIRRRISEASSCSSATSEEILFPKKRAARHHEFCETVQVLLFFFKVFFVRVCACGCFDKCNFCFRRREGSELKSRVRLFFLSESFFFFNHNRYHRVPPGENIKHH